MLQRAAKILFVLAVGAVLLLPASAEGYETILVDATVTLAVVDRTGTLQRIPEELLERYGDV